MKQNLSRLFFICLILFPNIHLVAQIMGPSDSITSSGNFIVAHPIAHRTVYYNISDTGISRPIFWGLDTAWPSEDNIRRGIAFMGAERVSLVRVSFQPTHPLIDGELHEEQIRWINNRLNLVNLVGPHAKLTINSDHPSVDPWFLGNASHWAQLMDVTTRHFQDAGRTVVSIAPFNEPDYGWGQGSMQDFYDIAGELKANPRFVDIRISGPNTLSCDAALPWYDFLKDRLDEGNTHQLAGSFNNYANFYETVRANGHHATNDELHNVVEAMVGAEYGMQTGIWWESAALARGEFVKASFGERLGYAEHRPNWTAASVYRNPEGKIQAFGGASERQAVTTSYRFLSTQRDVFYDGHGPQREYILEMPGGTGYWQNQPNAERVINITWGEDIQPVINGRYVLVNHGTGKVMEVANGNMNRGSNLQMGVNTDATYQQFIVSPVSSRIGGDFSYFAFTAVHSGKSPDILNWSLADGGNIIVWDDVKSANQQWYLEYAEDGWFFIRSRHSNKCLDGRDGTNIAQWDYNGNPNQQWRFLPVGAQVEFDAPAAPNHLTAVARETSVLLSWTASPESDLESYIILRSDEEEGPYNTIARNVTTSYFVDNTTTAPGKPYYYKILATDRSMNRSLHSDIVAATPSAEETMVAHYHFDGNTIDNTINLNHSAASNEVTFESGKVGSQALSLNNNTNDFIQLPATIANHREISVAAWVYWNGGSNWQRIFDFGNSQSQYMFLSPKSGANRLHFEILNNDVKQTITGPALSSGLWTHVALTLGDSGATLYVNGQEINHSETISHSPLDFNPVLNYIGRSQFPSDPFYNGNIDDFRIYNYVLSPEQVLQLAGTHFSRVKSIHVGTQDAERNLRLAYAEVTISDHQDNALAGATVIGTFRGTINETVHGITNSDGLVMMQSTDSHDADISFDFCIDNVIHADLMYYSSESQLTCLQYLEENVSTIVNPHNGDVKIYPNPINNNILNIDIAGSSAHVSIVDLHGKTLIHKPLNTTGNQLDLSVLSPGIYVVSIKTTLKISNHRIIKN